MKTTVENITPQIASGMLENAQGNRPVRNSWVEFAAGQMSRGQWDLTHQGIAFDNDGRLIDGQHRLFAVILSGKTIPMLVTRGLNPESYKVIDSGLSRTIGDRLKLISSSPRINQTACAIVRSYLIATGSFRGRVSVDVIDNCFLTMADEITEIATEFSAHRRSLVCRSEIGAAIACYMSKHKEKAREFLRGYTTGARLVVGDPALSLRMNMLEGRIARRTHEGYWKTITATRAHYDGRQLVRIEASTEDWRKNQYLRVKHDQSRRAKIGHKTRMTENMRAQIKKAMIRPVANAEPKTAVQAKRAGGR